MRENPAHIYRDVAKKIVAKLKQNLVETLETGKAPDLYWKLEQAIVDAMKYADGQGCDRTREQMQVIISDFEDNDGTSQN